MGIERLRGFVQRFTELTEAETRENVLLDQARRLLAELIAVDDWLPQRFTEHRPERYQQYLLHCDPLERFSVVSFVWGPGQRTPVHDHTVWGLIGLLRGEERSRRYERRSDGSLIEGAETTLRPGMIESVSPTIGDIHLVENGLRDCASISIHVYGANIGAVKRHIFDVPSGAISSFISGYSSEVIPNLWDRSEEVRRRD
jgi:predicted metal-dependent enzyme (double-stranded beta helix superfamily)